MTFRRIVVALGTPGSAAITTAIELARTLESEVLGLFVEDVALFDLASLPFAGEVGFPSAARRALDVDVLERSLRAQAGRLRQEMFARLAGMPNKWAFEVVRGRVAVALAAAAGTQDLVVVPAPLAGTGRGGSRARAARAFRRLPAPLLLIDETRRPRRAIGVIAPADIDPSAIVDVVGSLVPYFGPGVRFVGVGSLRSWDAWQGATSELLAGRGLRGRYLRIARTDADALRQAIADDARGVVVMLAPEAQSREALLELAALPLLLLPQREGGPEPDEATR
jgi:hypothetical protein